MCGGYDEFFWRQVTKSEVASLSPRYPYDDGTTSGHFAFARDPVTGDPGGCAGFGADGAGVNGFPARVDGCVCDGVVHLHTSGPGDICANLGAASGEVVEPAVDEW